MDRRRRLFANLFVVLMIGLGGALVLGVTKKDLKEHPPFRPPMMPLRSARLATHHELVAAKSTIEGQLKAFKANDYVHATDFQAMGMHSRFDHIDGFRQMIQQNYPEFSDYRAITYGDARATEDGDMIMVPVRVTGEDQITVQAVYILHRENGQYKVAGVEDGFRGMIPHGGMRNMHFETGRPGTGGMRPPPGAPRGAPPSEMPIPPGMPGAPGTTGPSDIPRPYVLPGTTGEPGTARAGGPGAA